MRANQFKRWSLTLSVAWICVFFIFPLGLVIGMSVLHYDPKNLVQLPLTFSNYQRMYFTRFI